MAVGVHTDRHFVNVLAVRRAVALARIRYGDKAYHFAAQLDVTLRTGLIRDEHQLRLGKRVDMIGHRRHGYVERLGNLVEIHRPVL